MIWDEEMVARAAGMKRAGFTNAVIAKRLGVTTNSLGHKLAKIGAKRRLDGNSGKGHKGFGRIAFDNIIATTEVWAELQKPAIGEEK